MLSPFYLAAPVRLDLALVTLTFSSIFTSCGGGSESIFVTCTSLETEGFLVSATGGAGVVFCAFVFAFESSEGPASSVAFFCCSLEDVFGAGEGGGAVDFWTLAPCCDFDIRVQSTKNILKATQA